MSDEQDTVSGSAIWTDYIDQQVAREDARQDSIEKRGLAVITSAGVLGTLLFGIAAFSSNGGHLHLPHSAKLALTVGMVGFLLAAVAAIGTTIPFEYDEPTVDALTDTVRNHWDVTATTAEQQASFTRIKFIRSARKKNGYKGNCLLVAVICEALAVTAIALGVGLALYV